MEAHIFGGAYLKSEICFSELYSWKEIYRFCFVYFVFEGNFQVQATGGLIFGGAVQRRFFFALPVWGGLYLEGPIFGILR